tara:strand:- start:63 stop:476 length:414 start_codon:yes stop_codon:yes gene_type:complete
MAFISNISRRHPIDLNKNSKVGVAFPLDQNNLNTGTSTLKEQAKTNLINVLLTEPGERVYQPNFGIGLKKLLFESKINTQLLNRKIDKQIRMFVPQIQLKNTSTDFIENENLLYIRLTYKFLLDSSEDTIQLNFNSY